MGLLSALFGGSSSKSSNQAYPYLQGALSPAVSAGTGAIGTLSNALNGGFDQYLKDAGFNDVLSNGLRGITGANAAKGLLRSGADQKALLNYSNTEKGTFYQNWLNNLQNLGQLGLGAAGTVAGAGSTSSGSSNGGIIPGLASLFSDRRLKTDISVVGKLDNGLPVYAFRYIDGGPMQIGLMADDVEKLHPEAVGEAQTFFSGGPYKTVDYGKAVL